MCSLIPSFTSLASIFLSFNIFYTIASLEWKFGTILLSDNMVRLIKERVKISNCVHYWGCSKDSELVNISNLCKLFQGKESIPSQLDHSGLRCWLVRNEDLASLDGHKQCQEIWSIKVLLFPLWLKQMHWTCGI